MSGLTDSISRKAAFLADACLVVAGLGFTVVATLLVWYVILDRKPPLTVESQFARLVDAEGTVITGGVLPEQIAYVRQSYCLDDIYRGVVTRRIVDTVVFRLQDSNNLGQAGCFKNRLFPVTIPKVLPGGSYELHYRIFYYRNWVQELISYPIVQDLDPIYFEVIDIE